MSAPRGQQPSKQTDQSIKRKGRTYNLSSKAQNAEEDCYLTVSVPASLERRILQVIKDNLSYPSADKVSKRMSAKKLTDMYVCLESAGFLHGQIAQSLSTVIPRGGDVIDALDWLCLHTKDEDLPAGFSSALSLQEEFAHARPEKKKLADQLLPPGGGGPAGSAGDVPRSDPEAAAEAKEKYEECLKKVNDLKKQLCYAEKSEDQGKLQQLSQQIKLYVNAMHEAEAVMHSASSLSLTDGAAGGNVAGGPAIRACEAAAVEGRASASLAEGSTASSRKSASQGKSQPKDSVRQFAYTRQTWTGKSPKQFLIDWVRKHLPSSPAPTFERIPIGGDRSKCRVKIDRKKDGELDVVAPGIVCENFPEAQHLSATYALYHLCRGQQVHQLLPPPYRAVWLEWDDAEKSQRAAQAISSSKERDEFVASLLKKLKQEVVKLKPLALVSKPDNEEDDWMAAADNFDSMLDKKLAQNASQHSDSALTRLAAQGAQSAAVLQARLSSPSYLAALAGRQSLPMYSARGDLLNAMLRSAVIIVAGETGCGKSTQVPQIILEDYLLRDIPRHCSILVTEPRRLAAVSLANRVAYELCDPGTPGGPNSLCGYQIRFESKVGSTTCITYCTVGVALRKFQQDILLSSYTHIIVDEVHERSVESDLLMILLKDLLAKRHDLQVILMSATLESERMSSYYSGCPVLVVPGKTYNVNVKYIEDLLQETGFVPDDMNRQAPAADSLRKCSAGAHKEEVHLEDPRYPPQVQEIVNNMNWKRINVELIVRLLHHIDVCAEYSQCRGAVLIFLPGYGVIEECFSAISADPQLSDPKRYKVFVLHSALNSPDQKKVFDVYPDSVRKIVLATNIAESSITIPDAVFVIDSGKVKENHYSEVHQISSMRETWVSRASADQRRGRAGRVRDGHCWRLFTSAHYHTVFDASSRPEMQRVSLTDVCLHIMGCGLGNTADFLRRALDPPEPLAVTRAVRVLLGMGACQADEQTLTALGQCLRLLPVEAQLGKMLVYAALLECLEPAAIIAAAASVSGSLFSAPFGAQSAVRAATKDLDLHHSDHWTAYAAFVGWLEARSHGAAAERDYCRRYCLKKNSLLEVDQMRKDFVSSMKSAGLHSDQNRCATSINPSPSIVKRVQAALTAGLYPNVALFDYQKPVDVSTADDRILKVQLQNGEALIHQNSVARLLQHSTVLVFQEKVKRGSIVYAHHCTSVSPVSLLLFADSCCVQHLDHTVVVDKWITISASAKTAVLFKELRILVEQLLARKMEEPQFSFQGNELADVLGDVVSALA